MAKPTAGKPPMLGLWDQLDAAAPPVPEPVPAPQPPAPPPPQPPAPPAPVTMPAASVVSPVAGPQPQSVAQAPLLPPSHGIGLIAATLPGWEAHIGPTVPTLRDKFVVPPFSALDAKAGYWQERKAAWLALGIQSEVGRDDDVLMSAGAQGRLNEIMGERANGNASHMQGVSIFDPVLCEAAVRWYSPLGGTVYDPFAGGSVRGVVAAALARRYVGQELRPEQIASNVAQWAAIAKYFPAATTPAWLQADSTQGGPDPGFADLVFSCPPYGDLEQYSSDPRDLSTMPYDQFIDAYFAAVQYAAAALKPDRYAVWVVGDFRDKAGNLRGFVRDSIDCWLASSEAVHLYAHYVLLTPIGSLPVRTSAQFPAGRKPGKAHQDVLVFTKGDGMRAAQACGPVEVQWAVATG